MKKSLVVLGAVGAITACVAVGHKIYKVISGASDVPLEDRDGNSSGLAYKLEPSMKGDDGDE